MRVLNRLALPAVAFAVALGIPIALTQSAPAFRSGADDACRASARRMIRLELLFGMSRPDGGTIGPEAWQAFVDTEVTPRFPQGLTVMTGRGQWLGSAGAIAKEQSHMLTVWYPAAADNEAKIEAIRTAYKTRFSQESVMRIDGSSCVSF
jgi:Protein of unknown function (DUF3574)